jgi:hypothetical protein
MEDGVGLCFNKFLSESGIGVMALLPCLQKDEGDV